MLLKEGRTPPATPRPAHCTQPYTRPGLRGAAAAYRGDGPGGGAESHVDRDGAVGEHAEPLDHTVACALPTRRWCWGARRIRCQGMHPPTTAAAAGTVTADDAVLLPSPARCPVVPAVNRPVPVCHCHAPSLTVAMWLFFARCPSSGHQPLPRQSSKRGSWCRWQSVVRRT